MKFDVIIGNPPYQLSNDSGAGAVSIFQHFINKSIELNPKKMVFITPSKWMVGGALKTFKNQFKIDKRLKYIKHFKNAKEIFPTVEIKGGVSYFVWDRDYNGLCEFEVSGEDSFMNDLDINDDILMNKNLFKIIDKLSIKKSSNIFAKPNYWKLSSNHFKSNTYLNGDVDCYSTNRVINRIEYSNLSDKDIVFNKYNIIIPGAMGDGFKKGITNILNNKMIIVNNMVWTETYTLLNSFDTQKEAENFIKYMESKLVVVLLSTKTTTQRFGQYTYSILEDFDKYDEVYDDEYLYKHYGLSQDEIDYIEESVEVK